MIARTIPQPVVSVMEEKPDRTRAIRYALLLVAMFFAVYVFAVPSASAQGISAVPAVADGKATCGAKYDGSFWDPLTNSCWTCPASAPTRTVFSVTSGKACERPAHRTYKKANGPRKPFGLLKTDCNKGWFLDIGIGSCYSCPSGYKRGTASVKSSKACFKKISVKWARATDQGKPGCAEGSFRNGLSENCFKCPAGYIRNMVIGSDLTNVKACSGLAENATRERYNREKDADPATQANGRNVGEQFLAAEGSNPGAGGGPGLLDGVREDIMKDTLKTESDLGSGYDTIEWYVAAGGSLVAGYSHGYGYAMSYNGETYSCRTAETHTFVAGVTAGAGVTEEWTLSKTGLNGVDGESNGYNIGVSLIVGVNHGMEWDAAAPHSRSFTWGLTPVGGDANGEYTHAWTNTGQDISCSSISWDGKTWEAAHKG